MSYRNVQPYNPEQQYRNFVKDRLTRIESKQHRMHEDQMAEICHLRQEVAALTEHFKQFKHEWDEEAPVDGEA